MSSPLRQQLALLFILLLLSPSSTTSVAVVHDEVDEACSEDERCAEVNSVTNTSPTPSQRDCTVMIDGTCVPLDKDASDNWNRESPSGTTTKENIASDEIDSNGNIVYMGESSKGSRNDMDDEKEFRPPRIQMNRDGQMVTYYGVPQEINVHESQKEKTTGKLSEVHEYMYKEVYAYGKMPNYIRDLCVNRNELCTFWAAMDFCTLSLEEQPVDMVQHCTPACMKCDTLLWENRCGPIPDDIETKNIWSSNGKSNSVNAMFENIMSHPYYAEKYDIQVLSRPESDVNPSTTSKSKCNERIEPNTNSDINCMEKPWILLIDDFMTTKQCDTLIQLGETKGFQESQIHVEDDNNDDTHAGSSDKYIDKYARTSSTTWCNNKDIGCDQNKLVLRIRDRVSNITGIPDDNSEHIQLLKYQTNQYYKLHHDYLDYFNSRWQGQRIVTVFMYLNDVEEGMFSFYDTMRLIWPERERNKEKAIFRCTNIQLHSYA
jgi:2OG-Fe(II) oxygenase superfamily